ncbi:MAG: hypothetical protein JSR85_06450 [Proteobacteria bacterium]|nr:hypothetical protein [Pseudomonadota bacterium]
MRFYKRSIGTLFMCGATLTGCEVTNPTTNLDMKPPLASLNSKKELSPAVTQVISLVEEGKYKEASSIVNQSLQSQPKNVALHLLNGLIYEKLAEHGDASGSELAVVGYQNAINLDPSNIFAITQLGKLEYREQKFDQAMEHFANALLIKPNDPDLWQELAASAYYSYDLKTALVAVEKAIKLKPGDPLAHRSAAMIYAALGDFTNAQKNLEIFQSKAGNDPSVNHVASRLADWQSLYKSGRINLAAATTTTPSPTTPTTTPVTPPSSTPSISSTTPSTSTPGSTTSSTTPSTSTAGSTPSSSSATSSSSSASGSSAPTGGGGGGGDSSSATPGSPADIDTKSEASKVLESPLPTGDTNDSSDEVEKSKKTSTENDEQQIVIDCYVLRISEDAITSKGNNILENLAVTLTPGGYSMFKGSFYGSGAPGANQPNLAQFNNVTVNADQGFKANQDNNAGANAAFNPSTTQYVFDNKGSISGRVFTAGLTWAGLTYSLNIANAIDNRTEVVSRPSLMTFLKKSSVFFAGQELVNGFTGQYGGTLVKYPVGTTLEITPESLQGDIVSLTIGVEGSLLTSPNPNLTQTVQVAKTRVDTFVKLRLGETLMLGGIYERQEVSSKNGFPGLQDVPVLQYFFSNESTLSSRSSIVIMLTPRSPDAVKAAVERAMTRGANTEHLNELQGRNPDWFGTHPNLVSVFRYLSLNPVIYYEFRSGDILPPSWGWEPSLNTKLQQLASFLYF